MPVKSTSKQPVVRERKKKAPESLSPILACIHEPGRLVDAGSVIVGAAHVVREDGAGTALTDAHLEPGRERMGSFGHRG